MRNAIKHLAALGVFAVLALFVVPRAGAQEAPDPPDRDELVIFTKAYIDVMEVRDEMEEKMTGATSQEEAQQIQQEANQKIVAAIQEHDLTPERYTEVTSLLNEDEELRGVFHEIYLELMEGGGLSF